MKKNLVLSIATLCTLLVAVPSGASQVGVFSRVGLDYREGRYLPPDITLRDETGRTVTTGGLLDRPAVLVLTYYRCTHICPEMLAAVTDVIGKISLEPGKDYRIITLSFDDRDTPSVAKQLKVNYVKAIGRSLPEGSWKFLTGDRENIRRVLTAVGYGVKEKAEGFDHPAVLVFISPGGKITRYMNVSKFRYGLAYPVSFSPVDFTTSIMDASMGKTAIADNRAPLYCLLYKPVHEVTFFRLLQVSGLTMLVILGSLFVFLAVTAGRHEKKRRT
ncbi:MAG: SCO family protein [Candidatus Sulfobium sp.]